jgi:hypothetical protein
MTAAGEWSCIQPQHEAMQAIKRGLMVCWVVVCGNLAQQEAGRALTTAAGGRAAAVTVKMN